ncbi:m58 protein [Murid betaherpesvirus 1]|uniref:M58 protein n=2 Tax=Murid herpesvirus 1 TaxID=10366 RepID=H2A373_MUHV1|nr:m58 [Muromegalovirus C4A]CCE56570.1 m58 protein [Murid betaherpesvirus 1]CCE56900.1 m58 protein [Murid betaherpesvirus 1]CCE57394.1 m58 protein [Murid betaherpesvirus 1]
MTTGVALSQSDIAATMSASSRVFLRKNIQTAGATGARLERSSSAMATSPASKLYRSGGRSDRPRHQNLYIREAPGGFSSTKTSQSSRKRPRSLCHNVLNMVCAATCTNLTTPKGSVRRNRRGPRALGALEASHAGSEGRRRCASSSDPGPSDGIDEKTYGRTRPNTEIPTVFHKTHTRNETRAANRPTSPIHTTQTSMRSKRGQRESLLRVPVFHTPLDGTDSNNPHRNRFVVS